MKRIFLSVCTLLVAASFAVAQDVNQATDLYNEAVGFYSNGDLNSALNKFQKAYDIAKDCGEDGESIVTDCQTNIPVLGKQIAKGLVSEGKYSEAIAKLTEVANICKAMNNAEEAAQLLKMIPQFYMQQGNTALKTKNYAEAISAYDNILALDPANGNAALRKGQALNAMGDIENAIAAFELASKNGQEKAATRQLANLFVKKAKAASGAKDYKSCLEFAKKAASYDSTEENAFYLAGIAAQALGQKQEAISNFEQYLTLKPAAANSQAVRQVVEALKKEAAKN